MDRFLHTIKSYFPEVKATLAIAMPLVIAQIGIILMGLVDNIMVGKLGAAALGAVGIVNAIYYTINSIAFGGLAFLTPIISKANAEQDTAETDQLWHSCQIVPILYSVLTISLTFVFYFAFKYLGQTTELNALAKPYFLMIILSTLPLHLFNGLKQYSDGLSHTKIAMYITLMGVLSNIILNYGLIYGHWGMPAYGVMGAGLATLISRILMLGCLYYLVTRKFDKHFIWQDFIKYQYWRNSFLLAQKGISVGFQFFFEYAAFCVAAIMVGWLGQYQLAAHQIALSISSFTYMIASGLSSAGAIRVGRAVGYRSKDGILKAANASIVITILFMGFNALCFLSFPLFFVKLYISDEHVISYAVVLLMMAGVYQISDGLQVTALGLLRGLMDTKTPTAITLFSYWIIGLPLGILLTFYFDFGVKGIWIGLTLGLSVSAILLLTRFFYLLRKYSIDTFIDECGIEDN
ncbi:MAG: MATE family efflux transporter [Saprospiraceae bacterium]|nr:MATE family efflux transporter [Saprospiraceae bacterium]